MGYRKYNDVGWLTGVKPKVQGLYYLGEWNDEIGVKCAAVVGSRRMTDYGRRVTEALVPKLVDEGWIIVSGFMYGVDQAAHRIAIECGGKTVAVLGWGIEEQLVDEEKILAQKIIDSGGLIISEWKNQKGALWTFPQRNRIVAAMSSEIYVVEAAERSGAFITAELGIKMGKKMWAVPGPVTSRVSAGTNKLIAEGRAQMWVPGQKVTKEVSYTNNSVIYTLLQNEILTADELALKIKRPVAEIMAELTLMLLKGEVEEREGKYSIAS